jgi:hypothetical protein
MPSGNSGAMGPSGGFWGTDAEGLEAASEGFALSGVKPIIVAERRRQAASAAMPNEGDLIGFYLLSHE